MTAWGEAPGNRPQTNFLALKGRDMGGAVFVSAFQALGNSVGRVTWAGAPPAAWILGVINLRQVSASFML